jgi:hypothetical protein
VLSLVAFHQLLSAERLVPGIIARHCQNLLLLPFTVMSSSLTIVVLKTTVNKSRITPPKINTIAME